MWGRYYRAGLPLFQSRIASCYQKEGKSHYKLEKVIYYKVGQSLLQNGTTLLQVGQVLQSGATNTKKGGTNDMFDELKEANYRY